VSAKRGFGSRPGSGALLVGLTGSFGTGKSTAARLFRDRGAQVIDTDRLAHEVFRRGNRLYPKIRALFPEIQGTVNRAKVARVVFRNAGKRKRLERLVHPYVFGRISEELRRRQKGIVVIEVPLLFESGFHRKCARTVVVKARPSEVVRRLRFKGFSKGEVEARWRAQWPLGRKTARADFIIENSKGLGRTRAQVRTVWNQLNRIERSLLKHAKRKR